MIPWLHFTGGDSLLFKSWTASSPGAIAGACIGLVILAIFERWIAGVRSVLERNWKQRTLGMLGKSTDSVSSCSPASDEKSAVAIEEGVAPTTLQSTPQSKRGPRSLPPFITSHDLPRGAMFSLQALLAYIMMLAVMTFQAAYLISIVVGLGIGEVLFGRLGGGPIVH